MADSPLQPIDASALKTLVNNHQRFLSFLQSRVGSRDAAEDLLQAALVKGIERGGSLRDDESVVAWFFRLLRNALVDHYRHDNAERRAVERAGAEDDGEAWEPVLLGTVCACMRDLLSTLKPEYALLIGRVDLEGTPLVEAAKQLDISANNGRVRLHRARQALRERLEQVCGTCTEHGCLACSCGSGTCSTAEH